VNFLSIPGGLLKGFFWCCPERTGAIDGRPVLEYSPSSCGDNSRKVSSIIARILRKGWVARHRFSRLT